MLEQRIQEVYVVSVEKSSRGSRLKPRRTILGIIPSGDTVECLIDHESIIANLSKQPNGQYQLNLVAINELPQSAQTNRPYLSKLIERGGMNIDIHFGKGNCWATNNQKIYVEKQRNIAGVNGK